MSIFLSSCVSIDYQRSFFDPGDIEERRYLQSRTFDTTDSSKVFRSTVATLQDTGHTIIKTDKKLGLITARGSSKTKSEEDDLDVVVSVIKDKDKMVVRISSSLSINPFRSSIYYQDFFKKLSQSLFLDSNGI